VKDKVANQIAQQLGGYGKLESMIKAKHFVYGDNELTFMFSGSKKANNIRIILTSSDTYDITFCKIKKLDHDIVAELTGIYAEDLKETIERTIGLCLSLSA